MLPYVAERGHIRILGNFFTRSRVRLSSILLPPFGKEAPTSMPLAHFFSETSSSCQRSTSGRGPFTKWPPMYIRTSLPSNVGLLKLVNSERVPKAVLQSNDNDRDGDAADGQAERFKISASRSDGAIPWDLDRQVLGHL